MSKSENISPTALITGHMWLRYGLSHPALSSRSGQRLDRAFSLLSKPVSMATGVSLDDLMLARHRGIDALLQQQIESGQVSQVVELAAGLSPRGWRICQRYGDRVHYIESDLPHMVERKRKLLDSAGLRGPRHENRVIDALAQSGPQSLASVIDDLDPKQGVAVISEGLINYLSPQHLDQLWSQIASFQSSFVQAVYLSDFYLAHEVQGPLMRAFLGVVERFVRGKMHVHDADENAASKHLQACGFKHWQMPLASSLAANHDIADKKGAQRVRILQASLKPQSSKH